MPKSRMPSIKNIARWIANGDGQGEGKTYKPFFKVRDVPSNGRSHIILGIITGRIHHYLSDLEYYIHILSEWKPFVCDIREQYALLPLEETLQLASKLNIRHPNYVGTRTPRILTTDIVLSVANPNEPKIQPISIKYDKEINPQKTKNKKKLKRTVEKLLLEKCYWANRKINCKIITERDISLVLAKNLRFLRPSMSMCNFEYIVGLLPKYIELFNELWTPNRTLNEINWIIASELNIDISDAYKLFGRAVWCRLLDIEIGRSRLRQDGSVYRSTQTWNPFK